MNSKLLKETSGPIEFGSLFAKAQYSNSALDLHMAFCLDEGHEMTLGFFKCFIPSVLVSYFTKILC